MAYLSIYRGIVVNRKDPEKRGRLKLKVPDVWGDDEHDYWALPRGMFSSNSLGLMAVPEVGAVVWVQFEAGDIRYPVWEHGYWKTDKSVSAAYDDTGDPVKVTLRTQSGQLVVISDKDKTIELIQTDGNSIKLDKNGISFISGKSVSTGSDGKSAQPGVLGDTNEVVLNGLWDAVHDLANALSQDIIASINQPYLLYPTQSATKTIQVLASLATLKARIAETKSQKVTLD